MADWQKTANCSRCREVSNLVISFEWGSTRISITTFIIFNIYINDLDDNIISNVLTFADDTKVFR